MVSSAKISAWSRPMNRSNSFHAAAGNQLTAVGSSAITPSITVPASILPNSRSESVIGRASSSMMFSGAKHMCEMLAAIDPQAGEMHQNDHEERQREGEVHIGSRRPNVLFPRVRQDRQPVRDQ